MLRSVSFRRIVFERQGLLARKGILRVTDLSDIGSVVRCIVRQPKRPVPAVRI